MSCKLCNTRKPRRYCPGVQGDICSPCCGAEREVTVACPLDCPYLREAREREKIGPRESGPEPNQDIKVNPGFLREHRELVVYTGFLLGRAALENQAVDRDVAEALEALVRTYRTLSSGLYYESHPSNPYADRIVGKVQEGLIEYHEDAHKKGHSLRDAEFLGVLVTYQRLARSRDNGRPKGRHFVDYVLQFDVPRQERETPRLVEL